MKLDLKEWINKVTSGFVTVHKVNAYVSSSTINAIVSYYKGRITISERGWAA